MSKIQKKILVLFDGSNFYHGLKKIGLKHQLSFNYTAFLSWLTKNTTHATYYIGEIKNNPLDSRAKQLFIGQQKLFKHLTRHHINISKGYMLFSGGKYHEKGVDVQIALDIAVGAYENKYDICYLISSDTDLIPAIKKAERMGKQVIYVGYKGSASQAMIHNCHNKPRLLSMSDLAQFVK